jgi:hypothetical protein
VKLYLCLFCGKTGNCSVVLELQVASAARHLEILSHLNAFNRTIIEEFGRIESIYCV